MSGCLPRGGVHNFVTPCMINMYLSTHQKDWDSYIPFILFTYLTCFHESTNESPFFFLYGQDAELPMDEAFHIYPSIFQDENIDYKQEVCEKLTEAWEKAHHNIEKF